MSTTEEIIVAAGGGSDIPPHPEGQYAATCIDVVDAGMVEMTWQGRTKKKHRGYVRFFCGEFFTDNEGKDRPLWVDKWFTLSLNEKGALRPFLEAWRGQKFTDVELRGFNVAKLVSAPAFIQVTHNPTPQRTYANVEAIMKLPRGTQAPGTPSGYVRMKDRPKDEQQGGAPTDRYGVPLSEPEDDGLPF